MNRSLMVCAAAMAVAVMGNAASAQDFSIGWSTIDGGGGRVVGGVFELTGTIGQHDASSVRIGGVFEHTGGFWVQARCRADFNEDDNANSQDFFDFLTAFFAANPTADFNDDGVINSQDFFDFLGAFFGGC